MAGNIKGITIEFEGNTTKLDQAIRKVNSSTKEIDKNLKQVDNALKFNPTSIELWRQKQDLLKKKISETEKNLDALKSAQAQMDASGVDKNSEEYQKLQREIITTESKLKTFKGQLAQIGNVNLKVASEQFKEWGTTLDSAGQKMKGLSTAAAGVVASLGAIAYKSGTAADDLNTLSKVYSINTTDLQKYKVASDLVDVSVEDIAKSHVKLEKSMSSANNGSKAQAEAFEALGVSVTNADGSLRSSDAVWQDTIAALGQMTNETERDATAQQLMGKSAANLNPLIEDQGETYKNLSDTLAKYDLGFVDQETLDKANEFNDQLDTMKAIGTVAISTVGSQLAAYLAPALEKVVTWIGQLASWLSTLSPEVLTVIGVVAGVVAAVAPVLIVVGKLATGISAIINLVGIVGPAIGGVLATLGPIVLAIAAVVAAGVLLYKNWDTIKAKALEIKTALVQAWNNIKTSLSTAWNTIKTTAQTVWNGIKTAITTPIKTASNTIKGIVDKIKAFFPINVKNLLSKIKIPSIPLPHFKLSGEFSLKNKTVPKLSIDWYKTGGIFDGPQVIGVGEAGPEAVVPLDKFWDKLDNMSTGETNIVININGAQDPKAVADEVKRMLIRETNQRRLAWQ